VCVCVCVGNFEQGDDGREEVWLYEVMLNVCIVIAADDSAIYWARCRSSMPTWI
jgi:hypothetical protein